MTQDEVIKLAKEAGFGNYAYEATGIFERFAAMVAAAEREKCTGTQEFVTLPREVVELAIEAIGDAKHKIEFDAIDALIAALKQPPTTEQSSVVQPQANQPAMTPIAQRKLEDLMASGYTISGYSVHHGQKHQHGFVTGTGLVGWWKPEGMEYPQPQAEQEPVGYEYVEHRPYGSPGETRRGTILLEHYRNADGAIAGDWEWLVQQFKTSKNTISMRPLYTHPQPKRDPLADEQIDAIADAMPGGLEGFLKGWGWRQFARAVLEATNNIK